MGNGLTNISFERAPDARQLRSRRALASALLELIEEKSFDEITIREITARAKIGGQTGDILGATQQMAEIVLLLGFAALA